MNVSFEDTDTVSILLSLLLAFGMYRYTDTSASSCRENARLSEPCNISYRSTLIGYCKDFLM